MTDIIPINGSDREFTSGRFILWFGACGPTQLMVWANHLEDALDEAVDWLADPENGHTGLLADDAVNGAYRDAIALGLSEEDAIEAAEVDVTIAGNCGNHILSWEWGITAENPTRAEILALQGR